MHSEKFNIRFVTKMNFPECFFMLFSTVLEHQKPNLVALNSNIAKKIQNKSSHLYLYFLNPMWYNIHGKRINP